MQIPEYMNKKQTMHKVPIHPDNHNSNFITIIYLLHLVFCAVICFMGQNGNNGGKIAEISNFNMFLNL